MRDARVHDDPPSAVIAAGAAPRHGDRQGDGAEGYTVRRVRRRQDVDIPALRQQHVRRQQRPQVDPGPRQHRQGVRRRGQTNTRECRPIPYMRGYVGMWVSRFLSRGRKRCDHFGKFHSVSSSFRAE